MCLMVCGKTLVVTGKSLGSVRYDNQETISLTINFTLIPSNLCLDSISEDIAEGGCMCACMRACVHDLLQNLGRRIRRLLLWDHSVLSVLLILPSSASPAPTYKHQQYTNHNTASFPVIQIITYTVSDAAATIVSFSDHQ